MLASIDQVEIPLCRGIAQVSLPVPGGAGIFHAVYVTMLLAMLPDVVVQARKGGMARARGELLWIVDVGRSFCFSIRTAAPG